MDYYIWLAVNNGKAVVIDVGFTEEVAQKRRRTFLRSPVDALRLLGVDARQVEDVVITHLHYDHAGNFDQFPAARFHLQEREMSYATGKYMQYPRISKSFEVDDVCEIVRLNYDGRVVFYNGEGEVRPGILVHRVGGHTDGLQFVSVYTVRGWVVLASDASHFYENMEGGRPFPTVFNVGEMLEGFDVLYRTAPTPEHIVPGHDPAVLTRYAPPSAELEGIVACLDIPPK
ncbi:MAG: N-acyl homoserine lactonase family protein [Castellaniella sp.]